MLMLVNQQHQDTCYANLVKSRITISKRSEKKLKMMVRNLLLLPESLIILRKKRKERLRLTVISNPLKLRNFTILLLTLQVTMTLLRIWFQVLLKQILLCWLLLLLNNNLLLVLRVVLRLILYFLRLWALRNLLFVWIRWTRNQLNILRNNIMLLWKKLPD